MKSISAKFLAGSGAAAILLPSIAMAATAADILKTVSDLISMVIPIIIALAIIYFLWGVLQYLMKAGEEQEKARQQMIWGIVAIAVMVSIWGLVGILRSTFQIEDNTAITPATVQFQQN